LTPTQETYSQAFRSSPSSLAKKRKFRRDHGGAPQESGTEKLLQKQAFEEQIEVMREIAGLMKERNEIKREKLELLKVKTEDKMFEANPNF
jgi:hypothetical protein